MLYTLQEIFLTNKFLFSQLYVIGGSDAKASACNAGDPGSISGFRRSPGEGHGYPLQSSCLENLMDRGYSSWDWKERVTHTHTHTHTQYTAANKEETGYKYMQSGKRQNYEFPYMNIKK